MQSKKTVGTIPCNAIFVKDFGTHQLYKFPKNESSGHWNNYKLVRIGSKKRGKSNWFLSHNGDRFSNNEYSFKLKETEPDLYNQVHDFLSI